MTIQESNFEEYSKKCPYWKGYGRKSDCANPENSYNKCGFTKCPDIEKPVNKYNVWICETCPSCCVFPYYEPYDYILICPYNRLIRICVRHRELSQHELLSCFLKVVEG